MKVIAATPCENCRSLRQAHISGFMSATHRRHTWEPLKSEVDPVLGPTEHEYWGTHVAPQSAHPATIEEPPGEEELERASIAVAA